MLEEIRRRWSTREFDPHHVLGAAEVDELLEAARWAPSARNLQPWQFAPVLRGDARHSLLAPHLVSAGSGWALQASLLVVNIARPDICRTALYDLGGAVQNMVLQAVHMGLQERVFAAFDHDGVAEVLGLPAEADPYTILAVGVAAQGAGQPTRSRKPVGEIRL